MGKVRNKNIPTGHKLHGVWTAMKQRCYNPNCKNYPNYGGRGIKVCKEWRSNYMMFFEWAISNGYAVGKHLDRIDNNKGYFPENCRFVTPLISLRNKRKILLYEYNGEKRTLVEWAAYFDMPRGVLYSRIKYKKLPFEQAISYKRITKTSGITSESAAIGLEVKRIIKKNGRFNIWVVNKLREGGFNITESIFSDKLHGKRDKFTNDELTFIYGVFKKHEFYV